MLFHEGDPPESLYLVLRGRLAIAIADADCWSIRTDSVLVPCKVSHATIGDMMAPVLFWMPRT